MPKTNPYSLFTDFDIDLFKAGKHYKLYEKFGSHITTVDNKEGTYFAVWAPSAKSVGKGTVYKYSIESNNNGIKTEKADPYARRYEHPPKTASIVWEDSYQWTDAKWMKKRKKNNALDAPYSVYEVHLGSWKKQLEENRFLSYVELVDELVSYVKELNFTHVELMPVMEFPYDPSWGYQITGYFAPTSRFGYPEEFKLLVDKFHQNDIGIILDWVPSHFPEDAHGLGFFDGSCLYEHPDKRKGYHPDWKSLIFNYGRNEVKSFLISNALFWLDQYHADGLRVDAVASMLFLDYSREDGQWEPNIYGGRENLDAISFMKEMNEAVYGSFPDVQTIAEESTSFPMVSKPTSMGGLGFGMKWMMGWMHDTLDYFAKEPIYRKHHQNDLTFSMTYAFTENFMLPLSHDEVVYGKQSILNKMPGDEWQKFANLRLLYSYMFTHPGTNLLFQGAEFGQSAEWNFQQSLDWHLLQYNVHKGVQTLIKDLNTFYKKQPALYQKQFSNEGFEWIDYNDAENSVLVYIRKGNKTSDDLIIVCNMTPIPRKDYKIGLPKKGKLKEVFNSDLKKYNGSGTIQNKTVASKKEKWQYREHTGEIHIPPLAMIAFKYENLKK